MQTSEFKACENLIDAILEIPDYAETFLQEGGADKLVLMLTNPKTTSVMKLRIVRLLYKLLININTTRAFFTHDCV